MFCHRCLWNVLSSNDSMLGVRGTKNVELVVVDVVAAPALSPLEKSLLRCCNNGVEEEGASQANFVGDGGSDGE